jgi:hypothetical protein
MYIIPLSPLHSYTLILFGTNSLGFEAEGFGNESLR